MLGTLKKKMQETQYRLNLRNKLQQESMELLRITLEEVRKEIDRRNAQALKKYQKKA